MVIRNNAQRPNDNKKGAKQRGANSQGSTVSITVSIGAADSKTTKKPEEVLKKADKVLYTAKEKGAIKFNAPVSQDLIVSLD